MIKKDVVSNTLIVGTESEADLYSKELAAIDRRRIGVAPALPLAANAKIRYRQADQACEVAALQDDSTNSSSTSAMRISFSDPQRAVASGQIVAVYQGDELLGS
ncbi:hypothetical protein KBC03_05195 [Patescibacteria group bacterium]|nr:hypothetical protein [Patescibacteria group bacterium]